VSDDVANLLAEMQADFLDDLPGRCDRLEECVLALESAEPGAFDELYRQIHSLKGTGGMFGIHVITAVCHQFESFIGGSKKQMDRQTATTALAYVDLLRKTSSAKGRDAAGVAAIEQVLERLRLESLSGRASVLMVDPSDTVRLLYKDVVDRANVKLSTMAAGIAALERMLREPFDLLVISRELPDLNAVAVVAALRESRSRNSDIPVVLVSNNPAPVPAHLGIPPPR
jgi:chemotaxis protein histidine kinase CheA